jgi:hypothetical protein
MALKLVYSGMPKNINSDDSWSELDLSDFRFFVERGDSAHKIADFLCRTPEEVISKAMEMGWCLRNG